jgi:hypothetical protein
VHADRSASTRRLSWSPSVAFLACSRQVGPLLLPCEIWLFDASPPEHSQRRNRLAWAVALIMHPSNFAHWSLSTARDLTLEAANNAGNVRRTSTRELPSGQLKKLLDSRSERDVLEGLRRVVTVGSTPPTTASTDKSLELPGRGKLTMRL